MLRGTETIALHLAGRNGEREQQSHNPFATDRDTVNQEPGITGMDAALEQKSNGMMKRCVWRMHKTKAVLSH